MFLVKSRILDRPSHTIKECAVLLNLYGLEMYHFWYLEFSYFDRICIETFCSCHASRCSINFTDKSGTRTLPQESQRPIRKTSLASRSNKM